MYQINTSASSVGAGAGVHDSSPTSRHAGSGVGTPCGVSPLRRPPCRVLQQRVPRESFRFHRKAWPVVLGCIGQGVGGRLGLGPWKGTRGCRCARKLEELDDEPLDRLVRTSLRTTGPRFALVGHTGCRSEGLARLLEALLRGCSI
ncbi:hypothetical protein T439DRAFT_321526 [Meredithblackwellia eburnea MCA 4105]